MIKVGDIVRAKSKLTEPKWKAFYTGYGRIKRIDPQGYYLEWLWPKPKPDEATLRLLMSYELFEVDEDEAALVVLACL